MPMANRILVQLVPQVRLVPRALLLEKALLVLLAQLVMALQDLLVRLDPMVDLGLVSKSSRCNLTTIPEIRKRIPLLNKQQLVLTHTLELEGVSLAKLEVTLGHGLFPTKIPPLRTLKDIPW